MSTFGLVALHALAAAAGNGDFNAKEALLSPDFALTGATWLTFGLLVFLLKKFGWGPFTRALEEREARISESVMRAETARREAEELLNTYNQKLAAAKGEADRIIGEARGNAEKAASRILEDGRKAAEEATARAMQSIESERQKAVAELNRIVADSAVSLAGRIMRAELDPQKHRALIESTIREIKA